MFNMKKEALVAAAISGMMLGVTASASAASPSSGDQVRPGIVKKMADTKKAPPKHACKGKNECKGQGGCKTDKHECKGHNECKGQGGCATDGSKK
jgi:hypothetical protein